MKFYCYLTTSVIALMAAPVHAQAQNPNAKSDQVQDIVVTAQRVSTSVQRTPISIQAYNSEDLKARGVSDVTSLAQADSSVNINFSTGMPIIAIRGVSSQNATEVGDPAVSVASDGVFNNRPYGVFGALYDLDRVEILRGPQGTLFGRNSTGGTLNIINARPTARDEGQVVGEIGNYGLLGVQGFANVVVADGLSARVSFDARARQGYRINNPVGIRGDDEDVKSGRFQLAYNKGALKAWVLGEYTQQGGFGAVSQSVPFSYVTGSSGEPVHKVPANLGDGRTFALYAPYIRDLRHWELRGGVSYTFDNGISLNYLGGYDSINYLRQQAIDPNAVGFGNGSAPLPFVYRNREQPKTVNQELRIASATDKALTWQAGVYYFCESSSVAAVTEWNPGSSIAAKGVEFQYPTITSKSTAIYGQLGYAVTEKLKLSAGARYTWDEKARNGTFFIYGAQTGLPFTITIPQPASTQSKKPTWSVDANYQITPRNLAYAKVSTGYKVGGFNDATSTYGPETVTSYEIGSKNSFLDNHLQANLSVFRMDYNNQQVTQFVSGATSSGSMTVNAGKSRIWGAELNLVAQSRELGRLTVSGNYTHARYLTFLASAGWDGTINLNLSGNRLPMSPTWSFSGLYEHPFDAGNGYTVTPRITAKYQTMQYFAATNYQSTSQSAYGLVDLGLDIAPESGKWALQFYVKNVANETVFSDASEQYLFNYYSYAYQPPRTFGARLTVNFK